MESRMTTRKSTMASKYVIRNEPVLGCEHRAWTVYNRGYPHGRFESHEQALIYAIERVEDEHRDDWLLTYALVDSRWIMFFINEDRKMFCVIDNQHTDQMKLDSRKAYRWMCRLKISHRFRRELTGIVIFNETLNNKLKEATRGEWISYA